MTKSHAANHHSIQTIQRSAGRSSVAAAAYRHNARMTDDRTGLTHDFRRKGDLIAEGVIGWTDTPETLWNAAEQAENRKNSITAREIVLALPHELDTATQERLIRGHCLMLRDRYGVACSWVIHDPEKGPNRNKHAHIMMTSREVNAAGEFGKKTRVLDDRKTGSAEFEHMREAWAKRANAALKKAGVKEMIDHRSHARRAEAGEAPPQEKQRHMGPRLTAIARKHEAAAEQARAQGKPEPIAPRFLKEAKRIRVRNAALWGLFDAHKTAQRAANTDGKIEDRGDGMEAQAIEETTALFEAAMASPLFVFRLEDRRRREKERQRQREQAARQRPTQRPPQRPQGGGVVQLKHTGQERPHIAPHATPEPTPTAQAKRENVIPLFEHKAQPQGLGLVEALKKGLAEQEPARPKPKAKPRTRKAKTDPQQPGLFDKVLSFFTPPKPEPERQTEQDREGPKPWQRVETPTKPPEPPQRPQKRPAEPQARTTTPQPQSRHTDEERAAIIAEAARAMLPKDGEKPRHTPPHLRRPPPPPVLKPRRERTRGPPQR
ncbi:MAG: MobA/MobL family protein [Natronohydrobacter sp.]|nr:MobA/MobL family protein [Natronohydrobacter sp.]